MEWGLLIPILAILMGPLMYLLHLKEKRMKYDAERGSAEATITQSKVAELEQRVRVLEQIVTDGGIQTAAQIEALRDLPTALPTKENVQ